MSESCIQIRGTSRGFLIDYFTYEAYLVYLVALEWTYSYAYNLKKTQNEHLLTLLNIEDEYGRVTPTQGPRDRP